MKNGGYIMIDCTGVDLTAAASKTIAGLYDKFQTAMATGKPVVCSGLVMGTGKPVTPVYVEVYQASSTAVAAVAGTLQINVTNANAVTITDLTA